MKDNVRERMTDNYKADKGFYLRDFLKQKEKNKGFMSSQMSLLEKPSIMLLQHSTRIAPFAATPPNCCIAQATTDYHRALLRGTRPLGLQG